MEKLKKLFGKRVFDIIILFFVTVTAIVVFIISNMIIQNKTQVIEDEKYNIYSEKIKENIDVLIKNKQELTLSIALALSTNPNIKKALKQDDISYLDLKSFSKLLSEQTHMKNAWFQVINSKGTTLYRSWVPKRGDPIYKARLDVAQMMRNPKVMSTISTGKFDMTFKSMVPVYDNNKFIGIFEIITHFNSIARQLSDSGLDAIFLVDKKYKKQLSKALTKTFVDDYYVANHNYDPKLLEYIINEGAGKYFTHYSKYILDKKLGKLIITYDIPDIHQRSMGTAVIFKELDSINMSDVSLLKHNVLFYTVLIILFMALTGYFAVTRKHTKELDNKVKERTKELNEEKTYIQKILDTNSSIILVTKNSVLQRTNKSFYKFFGYRDLDDFKNCDHDCICDFFVKLDDTVFPEERIIKQQLWSEYLANNKGKEHLVELKFKEKTYFFTISAFKLSQKDEILVTMQDITELKNKDKILYEQSKMAAMGEMIGNIAHQWRQPLTIISSGATGMKLKKDFGQLDDDFFDEACDIINDNAQYLSRTIDDFKNFIKGERKRSDFLISEEMKKLKNLISPSFKSNNIKFNLDIKEDIIVNTYENELLQCLINIFNNAKDAVKQNNESQRLIFMDIENSKDELFIKIKDNGGGIDETVLPKIFEPYFTTKHKSQGTGLGLHMAYKIIVEGMNGDIKASNTQFAYNNKQYKGAVLTIILPLKLK